MKKWWMLVLVLAALLAACGGDDDKDNEATEIPPSADAPVGVVIRDPWARATASNSMPMATEEPGAMATESMSSEASAPTSAAFMTLTNTSDTADRLIGVAVSPDVASVAEIHETTMGENDVMQMHPVDGIDIPAKETVELKPGGYHIMLLDLKHDLTEGEYVTLTLTFESGQVLTVEAPVRPLAGM